MLVLLFASGFLIGALVNYLSDVLPANRKLTTPVCLNCLAPRSWRNYLTYKSCESCRRKPALRAFLLPAVFIGLTFFFYFNPGERLGFWPVIILLAYFALVLVNDLEYRVVLHPVSVAGLVICFAYGYYLHGLSTTLLGGAAGFAIMYLFYLGGGWFTKYLSKRQGETVEQVALGFGDVSISAVIGLLLGWPAVTAGLMIGILAGGIISGLYMLLTALQKRYQPLSALPYTPFLILGAVVLLFMKG